MSISFLGTTAALAACACDGGGGGGAALCAPLLQPLVSRPWPLGCAPTAALLVAYGATSIAWRVRAGYHTVPQVGARSNRGVSRKDIRS